MINTKENKKFLHLNRSIIAGTLTLALLASCPVMTFGHVVVGNDSDLPGGSPGVPTVVSPPTQTVPVNNTKVSPSTNSNLSQQTVGVFKNKPNTTYDNLYNNESTASTSSSADFAKSLQAAPANGSLTKASQNSTVVFEGNGSSFAVNNFSKSSNAVMASNGVVSFGQASAKVAMPLAYKSNGSLKDQIIEEVKDGKLSGSGSGASGNINDEDFRKIASEFKKGALTKTWEEIKDSLKAQGYDVSGTIEDTFETSLTPEQKAKITVKGSWKEFYSKLQSEAKKKAADKAKKEEEFNKLPESEKAKIIGMKEESAKKWAAKSPEEKAKILAEKKAKELEKYKNEYFYSWNAELYNLPGETPPSKPEQPKTQVPGPGPGPGIIGFPPMPKPQDTFPKPPNDKPDNLIPGIATTVVSFFGSTVPAAVSGLVGAPPAANITGPVLSSLPPLAQGPNVATPVFYKPENVPAAILAPKKPSAQKPVPTKASNPSVATPVYYKGMW